MRPLWTRSNERFIRQWLVVSEFPLAEGAFERDLLTEHGGESAIRPVEKMVHHLPDGSAIEWRSVTSWGDTTDLANGPGIKRDLTGYAFANIRRNEAGKALLSIGSDESIRAWVNGTLVLDRRTRRQLTFDEDLVEIDMKAGDNALLVKVEQHRGPWIFSARVLERGAVPSRIEEIGPSIVEDSPATIVLKTDIDTRRASMDPVTVQAAGAGGKVFAERKVPRGETVRFEPREWPDGAYELRFATRRVDGSLYATHIPWYKGDAIRAARELVAAANKADPGKPEGMTLKMLSDLVLDRLGKDGLNVTGNPWWVIHSPLLEFEELRLEEKSGKAIVRPFGFLRLAYRDPVDASPQFCRVYLPGGYDPAKKWPLVLRIHGYNPENPVYVRWWSVDSRHQVADNEYARQGVIYMEPHGRGNTSYLGLGDRDILRVIELAKQRLSIDDNRVYLIGESMGGWGTWNVATRHPDLFAAIAPIYGGSDYHSESSEQQLAGMSPLDRFLADKNSSWSMADSLLNMPILVHHGDVDKSVNVEYSRYGVRMLERWGYNVRYVELPGYGHEELNVIGTVIEWLLEHRRNPDPPRVRLRSAELQNASAYWMRVDQSASPRDFMVVDAEIAGPNVIRVDSQNVFAFTLTPGPRLIDTAREVSVVWNGAESRQRVENGRIRLRAAGYNPGEREKNTLVAGPLGDILNTPFAIVVGTISADPAMKEACERAGELAVEFWKSWQRQPPRIFKDSALSDADAGRYSLLLIGGPGENAISRKLAAQLRLEIAADRVTIGGRTFPAEDARVQTIAPNPLNPERYALVAAAASSRAMQLWSPANLRNAEFDFTIEDGHVPSGKERTSRHQIWVAGGWLDRQWNVADPLTVKGDEAARAKSPVLRAAGTVSAEVLESYTGKYQIMPGFTVQFIRSGGRLFVQPGNQPRAEALPVSDTEFYIVDGGVQIEFAKSDSGGVTSFQAWQGGQQFTGKRVE